MRKLTKTVSALLIAVMLMSVVLCAPFTVSAAETFTSGDYEYRLLDNGTAKITKYKGYDIEIVIPSELNGYKVTSIGDDAFYGCYDLTIYGYENSRAQKYANKNNIKSVALEKEQIIGDTNGDGNVTIADATELQKYLANIVNSLG